MHRVVCPWITYFSKVWYVVSKTRLLLLYPRFVVEFGILFMISIASWQYLSSTGIYNTDLYFQIKLGDMRDIFKCRHCGMSWKCIINSIQLKYLNPHVSGWHVWTNWTAASMRLKLFPPPLASVSASAPLLQITTSLSSFHPRLAWTLEWLVCLCKSKLSSSVCSTSSIHSHCRWVIGRMQLCCSFIRTSWSLCQRRWVTCRSSRS